MWDAEATDTPPESWKKPMICPECREERGTPEELAVHMERHREVLPETFLVVNRGKVHERRIPTSAPCKNGCGRHLPMKGGRVRAGWREHESVCDGSRPIVATAPRPVESGAVQAAVPVPEAASVLPAPAPSAAATVPAADEELEVKAMAKFKCDHCGDSFDRPASLGAHKYRAHGRRGGKRGPAPEKPAAPQRRMTAVDAEAIAANGMPELIAHMRAEAAALRKRAERGLEAARVIEAQADDWEERFRPGAGAAASA